MAERDDEVVRQRLRRVVGMRPGGSPAEPDLPGHPDDPAPPDSLADPASPARTGEPVAAGDPSAGVARPRPLLGGPGPFDPGRRGVRALAAVAVVVVLVAGLLAWRARPRPEPVAAQPPTVLAGGADGPGGGSAGSPLATLPAAGAAAEQVVVAVAGKVRRPGLVRLPSGARVADAVAAAGGVLPGTDVTMLNLARKIVDGELIVVGMPAGAPAAAGAAPGGPGAAPGGPGVPGEKVNLNTATLGQLDGLPGVGPVLAQRILDYRTGHGGFRSVTELRQVDGIGDARYEQLKELVTC